MERKYDVTLGFQPLEHSLRRQKVFLSFRLGDDVEKFTVVTDCDGNNCEKDLALGNDWVLFYYPLLWKVLHSCSLFYLEDFSFLPVFLVLLS